MNRIIIIMTVTLGFAAISIPQLFAADETPDPRVLLTQAAMSLGGAEGAERTVETLFGPDLDRLVSERTVRVVSRGYKSLIITEKPQNKAGEQALVYKDSVLLYRKGMSRPVPGPPRQRMLGSVGYSDIDIASINYVEDYDVVSMEEDRVDGEESWVIDLAASSKVVLYSKVRFWISKERKVGIKAEFFAVSGRKLKSAEMKYYAQTSDEEGNRLYISEIRIRNLLVKTPNIAVIRYSPPILREVSEDELEIKLMPFTGK